MNTLKISFNKVPIYNSLFYHIYELALRSKSNKDMPIFVTIAVISLCFMFNVFSIFLILEGLDVIGEATFFSKENKFFGSLIFIAVIASYYLYNNHYKKLHAAYKVKYKSPKTSKAIIIVLAYYLISFSILLLSGLFKNRDWIFSGL